MNIPFIIYLADFVGAFNIMLWIAMLFCLLCLAMAIIWLVCAEDDDNKQSAANARKFFWKTIPYLVVSSLLFALVPSPNTLYLMAGASIVEDVARSPEAARIGDRIIRIVEGKLDQILEDTTQPEEESEQEQEQ